MCVFDIGSVNLFLVDYYVGDLLCGEGRFCVLVVCRLMKNKNKAVVCYNVLTESSWLPRETLSKLCTVERVVNCNTCAVCFVGTQSWTMTIVSLFVIKIGSCDFITSHTHAHTCSDVGRVY